MPAALIRALDDPAADVRRAAVKSLRAGTGLRFHRNLDRWRRWFAERQAQGQPH